MSTSESKSAMRRKALGLGLLLIGLIGGLAPAEVTPPTTIVTHVSSQPQGPFGKYQIYGIEPFGVESLNVPNSTGPTDPLTRTFIPWFVRGTADTVGIRATAVTIVCTRGTEARVLPFGPAIGRGDQSWRWLSISQADSADTIYLPTLIDSLWLWDESATSRVTIFWQ